MKQFLACTSAMALAAMTTVAFAQAPAAAPAAPAAAPAAQNAPRDPGEAPQFNAANVDPAAPFGQIDVAPAGATRDTVLAWAATLTEPQKVELTSRCLVITANAANFQATANEFCTIWVDVMTADPGATPLPGLGGPNPAGEPAPAPGAAAPAAR